MIGEYRHKNLTLQNDLNFRSKILSKFKVHKKVVEIFLTDIGIASSYVQPSSCKEKNKTVLEIINTQQND